MDVKIRVHTETLESQIKQILGDVYKDAVSDDVKYQTAEIYKDCVEPLVPKSGGELRKSAEVVKHKGTYGVRYNARSKYGSGYAKAQYEGDNGTIWPSSTWKRSTPNTYSHWNRHMSRADREAFRELVKEVVLEKVNHG